MAPSPLDCQGCLLLWVQACFPGCPPWWLRHGSGSREPPRVCFTTQKLCQLQASFRHPSMGAIGFFYISITYTCCEESITWLRRRGQRSEPSPGRAGHHWPRMFFPSLSVEGRAAQTSSLHLRAALLTTRRGRRLCHFPPAHLSQFVCL